MNIYNNEYIISISYINQEGEGRDRGKVRGFTFWRGSGGRSKRKPDISGRFRDTEARRTDGDPETDFNFQIGYKRYKRYKSHFGHLTI